MHEFHFNPFFGVRTRRVVRIVLGILLVFLLICTTTVLLIVNVPATRQWVVKFATERINSALEAELTFDDFNGSLLYDLTLTNVRLVAAGDTLLAARELKLSYDIQMVFVRRIALNHLQLVEPRVRLLRGMDSSWNFAHILKPPAPGSTPKPFQWTVALRDVSIVNGSIITIDSLQSLTDVFRNASQSRLNAARANISHLNLALSAQLFIKKNEYAVSLHNCSFREESSGLELRNCTFFASADTSRLEVNNFILQTASSHTRVRLIAEKVNLFASRPASAFHPDSLSSTFRNAEFQLAIHADSVSAYEVQRLLPAADALSDRLALNLDTYGTPEQIFVKRLDIKGVEENDIPPITLLSLDGSVLQPLKPSALNYSVRLNPMRLSAADVRRYLPRVPMPNLSGLGTLALERGTLQGTLMTLTANVRAASAAGNVETDCKLSWHDTLRYEASLTTERLNLAAITQNSELQSNLNTKINLTGQGATLAALIAKVHVEASPSDIAGRSFDELVLDANAHDGGIITVSSLNVHWNKAADFLAEDNAGETVARESDADNLHNLHQLPAAELWANGWINLQNPASPAYKLDARAMHLDLSRVLLMPDAATDASFTLNVLGSGFGADSLRGSLNLVTQEFITPKKAFDPFSIKARLEHLPTPQNPLYREFHLNSELAEAHLKGVFTMPDFISSFAHTVDNSIFLVRRKYHVIRDSLQATTYNGLYRPRPERLKPLDVEFVLKPHDLTISRLFSGFAKIQCIGDIRGTMRGNTHDYTFRLDSSSRIDEFFYTDGFTQVNFADTRLQASFHSVVNGDSLNVVAASARIRSDSVFRFNDFVFRHTKAEADYRNNVFAFDVNSVWDDSLLVFYTKARLDMNTKDAAFVLDSAWMLYRSNMEWSSVGKITSVLNKEGLLVENMTLRRPKAETVYLSGLVWFDHFSNALLTIESMPLQDINRLFPPANRIPTLEPLRGTLERMECRLSGLPSNPQLSLLLNSSNVFYNGTYLGRCGISATHQDSTVRGTAEIQNPLLMNDTLHTLKIRAKSLPLNLCFTDTAERLVSGKPIEILFDAEQMPLGAVDVFVPGITNLQGYADAHFTITGTTPENIMYRGNAVIPRASFVFEATNLKYYIEGKASLLNRTVTVENATIANDPLDYARGRAFANGTITVNGFDITGFDITARVPQQGLFVLGNASRIPNPQLFGDVIMSTGDKPLHFYGSLEQPFLRGDVNILEAKINFPEIKSVKTENKLFCFETVTRERGGLTTSARDCNQQEYALLMPPTSSADSTKGATRLSAAELATLATEEIIKAQNENATSHPADSNVSALKVVSAEKLRAQSEQENNMQANGGIAEERSRLSFADKIDYALNVNLRGNFSVTMDWGPFEQLVANLAQENTDQPLRYVKTPDAPDEHKLFGDLILRDGSTYKYYRVFTASGKLAFNTGAMSNPRLNLNALLRGQRTITDRNGTSEYIVNLGITGTKKAPMLKMNYLVDNVPGVGDSTKIQNDAIMLLLFGRTQDEFALGSGLGGVTQNYSSSLASRLLTDLLQGTGVVRSADISFGGGRTGGLPLDLSQARVQFTGEISNLGVLWQVANDFGTNTPNTSFSIDIPFRSFLDQELFRNIVLQITRSSAMSNSSVFLRQQREWEVKIGSRNSW
ncbi:MAG: translocation/assembly module TamB domain-containing protein [Ignavibacteria bacterium]|nr:translocation/assembly module TamB domain-containing protein [Ignavibacteria bacterium]